jgi:hypothetical protein
MDGHDNPMLAQHVASARTTWRGADDHAGGQGWLLGANYGNYQESSPVALPKTGHQQRLRDNAQ